MKRNCDPFSFFRAVIDEMASGRMIQYETIFLWNLNDLLGRKRRYLRHIER